LCYNVDTVGQINGARLSLGGTGMKRRMQKTPPLPLTTETIALFSLAHAPTQDRRIMQQGMWPAAIAATADSYLLSLRSDGELDALLESVTAQGYSDTMCELVRRAWQAKCRWMLIEGEAEAYDDLPVFLS
jgi:hypothetical protein